MSNITPYLNAVAVGSNVKDITGQVSDAAKSGGYSAWIESITGKPPIVKRLPNNRAQLSLSKDQVVTMRKWLDSQVGGAFKKKEPSRVEFELSPVLIPWAVQYAIPAGLLIFLAGWISHYYLSK